MQNQVRLETCEAMHPVAAGLRLGIRFVTGFSGTTLSTFVGVVLQCTLSVSQHHSVRASTKSWEVSLRRFPGDDDDCGAAERLQHQQQSSVGLVKLDLSDNQITFRGIKVRVPKALGRRLRPRPAADRCVQSSCGVEKCWGPWEGGERRLRSGPGVAGMSVHIPELQLGQRVSGCRACFLLLSMCVKTEVYYQNPTMHTSLRIL